nr:PREDICTED: F-box only protein 40 [Lepisosteus oculatus]
MGRNNKAPVGQHKHCEKCFSRRCKAPIQISVSCMVINCRLLCGAVFHMCKEQEHQLLCPNEKVPCLNAGYGCPFSMARCKLSKHLEVCPASIVCCSMDWNRWPVAETDTVFYENVLKEPFSDEQLDLTMALRDQKLLFRSLKMGSLFPELEEHVEELMPSELEGAVGGMAEGSLQGGVFSEAELQGLTQEEREALAKDKDVCDLSSYKTWEMMFSKELTSCKVTEENLKTKEKNTEKKENTASSSKQAEQEKEINNSKEPEPDKHDDHAKTGLAPWQDGVLDRLGKETNVTEYNMYLVHHGSMLIRFGQIAACTPKEKDFVYGNLEAIEVKTVRTFKVPTSYSAKRSHIGDVAIRKKKENKAVDTSDLGVSDEDIPKWDEISATLLCSLEKELRGHFISETVATDGLLLDFGTQTYSFNTAPFKPESTLADIVEGRSPSLNLNLQAECVTARHNKVSSAFTFLCNHFFRRDEFPSHFKNVHADIQNSLNGWFEQRCPLAYLGCTYSQKRFHPCSQKATFTYNQDLSTFTLRPVVSASLFRGVKTKPADRKHARNLDSLSSLPFEILQHIAGFLDSFSLSQLAQVSHLMRDVCASLLQERGMVSLKWEKRTYSHGGSSWKARKKVWHFSTVFSTVDRWCFDDVPSMSEHLKVCPFYQTEVRSEPVALTSMCDTNEQAKETQERQSLVAMFLSKY